MFLKLDGVQGESKSPRHFGEIELLAFSWGGNHYPMSVIGRRTAQINDMTFIKQKDKASGFLITANHRGQPFGDGVLTIEDVSPTGSLLRGVMFRLTSILVASISAREDEETVALTFGKVEMMKA